MFAALYSWSCAQMGYFSSSEVSGSVYRFQTTHANTFGRKSRICVLYWTY